MKLLNSVVGIVHDGEKYLILKKKGFWIGWQFPKGAIEGREKEVDAVVREVTEETGLEIEESKMLPYKRDYWYKRENDLYHVNLTYFLVKVKKGDVKLSDEHSEHKWVTSMEAMQLLKYDRDIFEKVKDESDII